MAVIAVMVAINPTIVQTGWQLPVSTQFQIALWSDPLAEHPSRFHRIRGPLNSRRHLGPVCGC